MFTRMPNLNLVRITSNTTMLTQKLIRVGTIFEFCISNLNFIQSKLLPPLSHGIRPWIKGKFWFFPNSDTMSKYSPKFALKIISQFKKTIKNLLDAWLVRQRSKPDFRITVLIFESLWRDFIGKIEIHLTTVDTKIPF